MNTVNRTFNQRYKELEDRVDIIQKELQNCHPDVKKYKNMTLENLQNSMGIIRDFILEGRGNESFDNYIKENSPNTIQLEADHDQLD